jgi:hypothetical protein
MRKFFEPASAPLWLKPVLTSIRAALGDVWDVPVRPAQFAVSDLPPAADHEGGLVYVPDESGGAVPAFSDGTNWRRVTDRAVVS